jgi:hypothetical protein
MKLQEISSWIQKKWAVNDKKLLVFLLVLVFLVLPLFTSKSQEVLGVSESKIAVSQSGFVESFSQNISQTLENLPKLNNYEQKKQPSETEIWQKFELKVAPSVGKIKNIPSETIKGKLLISKATSCGFISDKFAKNTQVEISFEKNIQIFTVCEVTILPKDVVGIIDKILFEKLSKQGQPIEVTIRNI